MATSKDTQQLYDSSAADWKRNDPVLLSDYTARPVVLQLCNPITGRRFLDLGCGEGYVSRLLAKRGAAAVHGIDLSSQMVLQATQQAGNLSAAIDMVNSCFHNSALTGNFTVGSDYVISGNLSPDLGFGIFGVRRMGSKAQMALYTSQFDPSNPKGQVALDPDGMVMRQRVQAQSFWPLGVDQSFSHSGNLTYLEKMLIISIILY